MDFIEKVTNAAVGLGLGASVWFAMGGDVGVRPVTTSECEAVGGLVAVFSSTETPEALCLVDGQYWPVRVDAWSRYGRGAV